MSAYAITPMALLLEEDVRLNPRELSDAFAEAMRITKLEAKMLVRRARGIVLDRATPTQATAVAIALEKRGIRTRMLPCASLPKLPAPTRITVLERGEGMLVYKGGSASSSGAVAWDDLLVAVAAPVGVDVYNESLADFRFSALPSIKDIDDPESRDLLRENVILRVEGSQSRIGGDSKQEAPAASLLDLIEQKYSEKLKLYLDLILRDRSMWIRISMTESSYQATADAVRMGSAMGFRFLLTDLLSNLPDRCSAAVGKLLEPGAARDLHALVIADAEEMGRYTLWRAYLASPAGTPAPSEPVETIRFDDAPAPSTPPESPPPPTS